MDVTPGGRDESLVPNDARWGKEMDLPMRIKALTQTTSIVIFRYIAQARDFRLHGTTCRCPRNIATSAYHQYLHAACLVAQGLFERHKLIGATQLAMLVLRKAGELSAQKFDFLLHGPQRAGVPNPIAEWLPDSVWASVQALKVTSAACC